MATAKAQRRWRTKNRYVKTQLNVMAPKLVHNDLADIADGISLRGKGKADGFASFITRGLIQFSEHNAESRRLLEIFAESYERDRELYS